MFERVDVGLAATLPDAVTCSDAADALVADERRAAARKLAYAAHWADLHPAYAADDHGACRHREADGVPLFAEFAATELGMRLQTTTGAASRLMRDALQLRHRHPWTWEEVMTGRVEGWKARKVAQATAAAGLTLEQARQVDGRVAQPLGSLAFPRAMDVVAAEILAVDPTGQEARRQAEAQERYVSKGSPSTEHGLATLVVRTTKGDVTRFHAMVDHVADLMGHDGDTDPQPLRRVKAFALLANPAMACLFLARDRTTGSPGDVPDDTAPSASELAAQVGRLLQQLGPDVVDRLRPRTSLHLLLDSSAVATPGDGAPVAHCAETGPLSLPGLRELLGTDHVTVRPVLDPLSQSAVDGHDLPPTMRESVELLHPVEVFPFGTASSLRCDQDHTERYVPVDDGGPPGQTRVDNLGPLGRHHHRAKTFGGFACHQPLPGMFLWRTPTGHWYQVDRTGTQPLGRRLPDILRQLRGSERARSRAELVLADRVRFELVA